MTDKSTRRHGQETMGRMQSADFFEGTGRSATEQPGVVVGRYRLIEKLGEGGFGAVWRAEQGEPIRREVALKLIKAGMDSAEIIARFEAERQALALMEHPNIAGVLDAGTTEHGRPFFVMELVKGLPITEFADVRKLTIRERLELFIPVCHAVQHAHQKAILHRDLKPSNILVSEVDGKPVPKVIDFGIAKALLGAKEDAARASLALTQTGAFIGTPLYMSPEQAGAKADLDTRSDIYTLGVILYELLTGETPLSTKTLRSAAFAEVLRMIREGEALRPSSRVSSARDVTGTAAATRGTEPARLTRTLRGDLDWITLRALEKDRERRYGSAAALAADISRHLRSEPVEAGPPSALYRFRKLVRRNRLAFASAAIIFLLLVGGIAVSVWQAIRAAKAERLANSRLHHAQEARDAAEKLVSEAIFGLRDKLLPLGKINVMESMATAAEEYYAKLPADLVSDVTRRHEVMLVLNRALVATASSDDETTEASYTKALALARGLAAKTPGDEVLYEAQYLALLGFAHLRFGQTKFEELAVYGQQLAALADDWLRAKPKAPGALRAKLAAQCVKLISIADASKNPAAVIPLFLEVQTVANELKAIGGETMETRMVAAVTLLGKAMVTTKLGRSEASVKLFAEADDAFRAALAADGHPVIRETMLLARKHSIHHLKEIAKDRGDIALEREAYRQVKEVIAEQTALTEFEPARLERWKQLAWLYEGSRGLVRKFDGDQALVAWVEKGLAAADRAASPRFDRPTVRKVRSQMRTNLCEALKIAHPAGWELRAFKLLAETGDILLAPAKGELFQPSRAEYGGALDCWLTTLESLGNTPDQRTTLVTQARAMAAFSQRVIETIPDSSAPRRVAIDRVGKVAAFLRERGYPEAAELEQACATWKRELEEKFSNDPDVVAQQANQAHERGYTLLNELRAAPKEQKAALFTELEKYVHTALAYAKAHEAQLKPYDAARWKGGYFAVLGSAQIEMGNFAGAEASLREAMAQRNAAAAAAPNEGEANERRSDAAGAQFRLAFAVFRQGREDEARKIGAEAVGFFESHAKQSADFRRHARLMNALREYAELFGVDHKPEQLALYQRAAKAARETRRLLAAATNVTDNERAGISTDIGYTFLECGYNSRNAGDAAAGETLLREGVDFMAGVVAKADSAKLPGLARLLSHLHYDLGVSLADMKRPDEARQQIVASEGLLEKVGQTPFAAEFRDKLENLRNRLPSQ